MYSLKESYKKYIAWKDLARNVLTCKNLTSIPELSSHRYSVIFSANSEIFAFSAMFRAVPADFTFDISGHDYFSDEHF